MSNPPVPTAATAPAATVAIVDGTHLCLLLPAISSDASSCSPTLQGIVPALTLHHVRSFLSNRTVDIRSSSCSRKNSDDSQAERSDFSGVDSKNNVTAAADLTCLITDLTLHPHCTIQRPARREVMERVYVDCNDGIMLHHEVKSNRKGGEVVSLKRPRSISAGFGQTSSTAALLKVGNAASGTLVADYCGIGGLDQILFLPPIVLGENIASSSLDKSGKDILAGILAGSALTDGTSIILPRSSAASSEKGDTIKLRTTSDGTPLLVLPSIDPIAHWNSIKASTSSGNNSNEMNVVEPTLNDHVDEDHSKEDDAPEPKKQQPWKAKLEAALKSRLEAEERASKRRRHDLEVRRELVRRSRRALQGLSASNDANNNGASDGSIISCRPAMVRLRYGTMPLNGGKRSDGTLAVGLIVCIDVVCIGGGRRSSGSNDSTAASGVRVGLEGLHLSFSPATSSSTTSAWDISSVKVHSISGTVPLFQPNECVSIMASVDITGLMWIGSNKEADDSFQLAINALWKSGSTTNKKQGSVLGLLKLPHEALLLSFSSQDASSTGLTHEIDFLASNNCNLLDSLHCSLAPMPSAIFEYRDPRVITIDVSRCVGGGDGSCLQDMVDSVNAASIGSGGRNRIELCCQSYAPQHHPRIIVLAQTPEERLGMVRLVMKNLPDSAQVVGTTCGGEIDEDEEERKTAKVLLHCMSQEIKLLDKHRRMASEEMRLSTVGGLAVAQARTDEVASRIKRGWEG